MSGTILSIDLGLTNCKTVLFDLEGHMVDLASVAYPTYHPQPGWAEQDPEEWWLAVLHGMRDLEERSSAALAALGAVSVTGHMHALVCLQSDGASLGRAMVLGDQRSMAEADAVSGAVGEERIYHITGARMDASMPLAKICWLRKHSPEVHRRSRTFLACKDFVRHRLTGDLLTDPIDACGTSLYDIQKGAWSPELMSLAGIQRSQLPEVCEPRALAGKVRESAARAMGVRSGIPVVVGSGDDVEVLGSGLLEPGLSLEHLGTTGSILACADRPVFDPLMAVELYPHVMPGLWVVGGSVTAAGAALAWARRVLREDTEVSEGSPSRRHPDLDNPLIFVPHLAGERCPAWEPNARASWIGLSTTHTSGDLRRAVFEGIAFSLNSVLERIERLVGRQAEIAVSGRESPDDLWLETRASIYDRPLGLLETSEPTALGAMILGAVGTGFYGSLADACRQLTGGRALIEPRDDLVRDYHRLYTLYRSASDTVSGLTAKWAHGLPD